MNIGTILKNKRLSLGYTLEDVAKLVGTSKQTIHRYETGVISNIPSDKIEALAKVLQTTPAHIMGWENDHTPFTYFPGEPAKSTVLRLASDPPFNYPSLESDTVTFPVIGEVAAGYDCIALETWDGETVEIPTSYLKGRKKNEFFVLKVKGDSMYPEYQDGDKVLVLKQSTLNYSGQVGVVLYDSELATLKKVEYNQGEDWMRFVAINPSYPPKTIENEDLELCRVLGIPKYLIREINN